jgi:hypothetical protein
MIMMTSAFGISQSEHVLSRPQGRLAGSDGQGESVYAHDQADKQTCVRSHLRTSALSMWGNRDTTGSVVPWPGLARLLLFMATPRLTIDIAYWSNYSLPTSLVTGLLSLLSATLKQPRSRPIRTKTVSLYPALDRPALPVLPAQSRCLVRPNC